jgi:hypothetical protein
MGLLLCTVLLVGGKIQKVPRMFFWFRNRNLLASWPAGKKKLSRYAHSKSQSAFSRSTCALCLPSVSLPCELELKHLAASLQPTEGECLTAQTIHPASTAVSLLSLRPPATFQLESVGVPMLTTSVHVEIDLVSCIMLQCRTLATLTGLAGT